LYMFTYLNSTDLHNLTGSKSLSGPCLSNTVTVVEVKKLVVVEHKVVEHKVVEHKDFEHKDVEHKDVKLKDVKIKVVKLKVIKSCRT
jgi:hypothetical protein